jgi:uncharacterized protein (TIGR00251 family)
MSRPRRPPPSASEPAAIPAGQLVVEQRDGLILRLRVTPGASRERIVGRHGDALKIAVGAPPERGRANDRLLALLSAALGVAPAQLRLVAGAASRDKKVLVSGIDKADLCRRLSRLLDEP